MVEMLSIIMPVFNESDRIESNVKHLSKFLVNRGMNHEIILSNDGSTDNTLKKIISLTQINSNIKFVSNSKNMGRGYALKQTCSLINGSNVLFLDVDMPINTNLEVIPKILDKLQKYDVVIGSRFHNSSNVKRKFHRKLLGNAYRFLVKKSFPILGVNDTDVGLKGFNKSIFLKSL